MARYELADALRRLPDGTRINIVYFNSNVEGFAPELISLDPGMRERFVGYVMATAPNGSTALAPAMRAAFLMNAKRVVLLSDGLGNVGGGSREVLRDAREAMQGGVRIDTIGIGRSQDASLMRSLAEESGGLAQLFY